MSWIARIVENIVCCFFGDFALSKRLLATWGLEASDGDLSPKAPSSRLQAPRKAGFLGCD